MADEETGPWRTCAVTRRRDRKEALVRFVRSPEGLVVPDIRARLPGRGVWVDGTRAAVVLAARRKVFGHALKAEVTVPVDLADAVERLLAQDAAQALAMANKAGAIVAGFAKVETALTARRAGALLSASDAAADGIRKLAAAARAAARGSEPVPHLFSLSGHEMSLALGRENAIHLAVLAGAAGAAFVSKCRRLDRFRTGGAESHGPDAGVAPASSGPFVLSDRQDAELDE
jgi:hypothetical protein